MTRPESDAAGSKSFEFLIQMSDPLQIVNLLVTPVVLLTGTAILVGGLYDRLATVVTRIRAFDAEMVFHLL